MGPILSSHRIPLKQDLALLLSRLTHPSTGSFTPCPGQLCGGGYK